MKSLLMPVGMRAVEQGRVVWQTSATPEQDLPDFFQSTYDVGATLGKWDRENLERSGRIFQLRSDADAKRDRVGAHGQSADGVDAPA